MTLVPLLIPPGIYRSGTEYQSKGRWYDGNLTRFTEGRIEPMGGWAQTQSVALDGPGRGMHAWRASDGQPYLGIGTLDSLYVFDGDSEYDITPGSFPAGNATQAAEGGYSSGNYGDGVYGSSSTGGKAEATSWAIDNFGEHMVACASHDGSVYEWELSTSTAATAISGAPTGRSIVVTAERFLMVLGAGTDPRKIQWCDQEDYDTWTPSATNQAGDQLLQTDGVPIRGLRVRGQTLILTTTDAHTARYLGLPYVYGFQRVGEACGLVGSNAAVGFNGGAAWMSYDSFRLFDGTSVRPIPCEVSDYVFSDINTEEWPQVAAEHRAAFGEIIWRYPSEGSDVCDRYVLWNYRENHWNIGMLERSVGIDAGIFQYPLATGNDGVLYEHENGWTDDGDPRTTDVYLESGPVEIGAGDRVLAVTQVLPDEVTPGAWQLRLSTQFTPEGTEYTHGPYTLTPYTDVRVTGRQLSMKLELVSDEDARLGSFRLDTVSGGRR